MTDDLVKDKLRLICKCGTIYPVCEMPINVSEIVKQISVAKCPTCKKGGQTAAVYVEKAHERGEEPQDSKPVE
jgi:hypothetical protein